MEIRFSILLKIINLALNDKVVTKIFCKQLFGYLYALFLYYSPIDLSDVLPRLWPYLDHNTSSVRKATLQTLRTLTRPLVTHRTNGESSNSQSIDKNGDNANQKDNNSSSKDQEKVSEEQIEASKVNTQSEEIKPNGDIVNGDDNSVTQPNGDTKVRDDSDKLMWTPELLQEAMRYVYQRVLFEHVHEIQNIAVQVSFLQNIHKYLYCEKANSFMNGNRQV